MLEKERDWFQLQLCGEVGGLWIGISRAVGWGSGGPGGRAGSFRFVEDSKRVTEKGGDLLERGGLESDPDAWLAIALLELCSCFWRKDLVQSR